MCRIASGVGAGASSGLDLEAVAPQQRKALERRQKQRLRKRYFRALETGREPPEVALSVGGKALNEVAELREQHEAPASGTAARQMPQVQTVDAVVTRSRQVPYMSPSPAPATPPIQVVEMEQGLFLQQVGFTPMPMLLCAVQDVRPVSESMAVPMVMVDTVPAVFKGGQSTCVARSLPAQPEDVLKEMPVAEVIQRIEKAGPYEGDIGVESEGVLKHSVLPYFVKNTFIEVEDPQVDGMDQWVEGRARRKSRAQSVPAPSCR